MEILSEDLTMLRDSAQGYLKEKHPITAFRALRDAGQTQNDNITADIAAMGWMGIALPEDADGVDFGLRAAGLIATELGRNLTATPFLSTAVVSATLLRACGGETFSHWARKISAGSCVISLAIDETAKFRPERIASIAVRKGDGFVLNGRKVFVVDGSQADRLIVTARLDGDLALFWIDPAVPGVHVSPQITLDMRDTAQLQFDDVALAADQLLAVGDAAEAALARSLQAGRAVIAAEQLGVARAAAEDTFEYLRTRKQFGIEIGRFQTLQHRAADLYCQLEQVDALIAEALNAVDAGADNAETLTRAAKAKAASVGRQAAEEGVQMHGGIGMTDEMDLGLFMKRDRALAELLGDAAHHTDWLLRARGL